MSRTVQSLVADCKDTTIAPIPLPGTSDKILQVIVAYCMAHYKDEAPAVTATVIDEPAELTEADKAFVQPMDMEDVFQLMLAANYMEIAGLLHVTGIALRDRVLGKKPDEICIMLGCNPAEYTPEVEKQMLDDPCMKE